MFFDSSLAENSVRHIDTQREIEAHRGHYQIRRSHHEMKFSTKDKHITCSICSKNRPYVQDRGYSELKQIFSAERDD